MSKFTSLDLCTASIVVRQFARQYGILPTILRPESGGSAVSRDGIGDTKVNTRLLIAGYALLLVPTLLEARSPKLSKDLDADGGRSTVDVVVQFSRPLQPKYHERVGARGGHLN